MSEEEPTRSVEDEKGGQYLFQELPRLLHAYVSARSATEKADGYSGVAGDIDTPETPSLGMRSYLRIAARHPGRAARLLSELELLIERGPEDDIVDALIEVGISNPTRLRPSDDKYPDEFFGLMLPYLRAFIEAGEPVDDALPQTRWEWRARFDDLSGLFAGYYMYWMDDYPSHEAVIEEHLGSYMDGDYAKLQLDQLRELLAIVQDEAQLETALGALGCGAQPPRGLTYRQWMHTIEERLLQYLRENPPSTGPVS